MWIFYVLFVGTGLLSIHLVFADRWGYDPRFGILGAIVSVGVCALIAFLGRKFVNCFFSGDIDETNKGLTLTIEGVFVIFCLGAGLVLRILALPAAPDSSEFFDIAKITADGQIPYYVHGILYLYLNALHAVFWIFGNKLAAALWAQIILQLFSAWFVFIAARRMAGRIAADITLAVMSFVPSFYMDVISLNVRTGWLLIYSVALFAGSFAAVETVKWWKVLAASAFIGIAGYLDISGFTILCPVLVMLLMHKSEVMSIRRRIPFSFLLCLGTMGMFFAMHAIDSLLSGADFLNILRAWWRLYEPTKFQGFDVLNIPGNMFEIVFILSMMAIGIYSFWFGEKTEKHSPWFLLILILILLTSFGMFTNELNDFPVLFISCAVVAGVSLGQIATPYKKKVSEVNTVADVIEEMGTYEEETTEVENAEKKIDFIENPLPLPKKHVKRVLDYDIKVDAELDFDFTIDENDDYDLK
jgi:hypothetical protein